MQRLKKYFVICFTVMLMTELVSTNAFDSSMISNASAEKEENQAQTGSPTDIRDNVVLEKPQPEKSAVINGPKQSGQEVQKEKGESEPVSAPAKSQEEADYTWAVQGAEKSDTNKIMIEEQKQGDTLHRSVPSDDFRDCLTGFSFTDGEDKPFTDDYIVKKDSMVHIGYQFELPNDVDISAGKTYQINMPDIFVLDGGIPQTELAPGHDIGATWEVSEKGVITIIFHQKIRVSNVKGYIRINSMVDKDKVASGEIITINKVPQTIKLDGYGFIKIDINDKNQLTEVHISKKSEDRHLCPIGKKCSEGLHYC